MKIVHISDVHIGDSPESLLEAAAEAINAVGPDVTVLSGDLTQSGSRAEYAAAARFLARIESPVVGAPGNHDAPVRNVVARAIAPWSRFALLGLSDSWSSIDPPVAITAMNTSRAFQARADWSQGVYPRNAFEELLTEHGGWRVVAAHHPPISLGARVRSDAVRGAKAWEMFGRTTRTLLLCGHLHRFTVLSAPPLNKGRMIVAPTLSSSRTRRAGLGFVEIGLDASAMHIRLHLHDGARYAPALDLEDVI